MFHIDRTSSGVCEIRFDFHGRSASEIPQAERRAFMRLSQDIDTVNIWLRVLAADTAYSLGTVYEYAKCLHYACEWLSKEPVNAFTREPVGHSLLTLKRTDLRALFAWLDIPAHMRSERERLVKLGVLPPGYREKALSPSTHNLRIAALSAFYDWVVFEYSPTPGTIVELTENPLKGIKYSRPIHQEMQRHDGLLPRSQYSRLEPFSPLRHSQTESGTGPVVLAPGELLHIIDAIPLVSHGRNAANRNGALIRLLLWAMLRKEELVEARWEAIDEDILWVIGKGKKRRAVPIAEVSTWSYLQTYTNELQIPLEQRFHGPLLRQLDHEDRPITRHTIEHLIDALKEHFLAKAASVRSSDPAVSRKFSVLAGKLHSHIFRGTGATYMAKAGLNLITLSLLLGHSDPSTTKRYYIAAKQLSLTDDVQRICEEIAAALEAIPSSASPDDLPDSRSWYRRRGLITT